MNTRLKIDLNQGILEVEGTETFVKTVYDEFKAEGLVQIGKEGRIPRKGRIRKRSSPATKGQGHPRRQKRKFTTYSIVKDLDLSAKKNKQSLRDFFKSKSPSSNMEKNTVFVYYLQNIGMVKGITPNHIYSCYKDIKIRIPKALEQSLIDAARHKGWIDTSKLDDIKIATPGENFVEQDLPKKKE